MKIVGGTYDEFCFEPRWEQTYGSGLRACEVIHDLDKKAEIDYHTIADEQTSLGLEWRKKDLNVTLYEEARPEPIKFHYIYPLATPTIYPRPDTIPKHEIEIIGGDILYYGLIEGNAQVKGKRVVYDPQSPANPRLFSETGSTAEQLVVVVNLAEAKKMAASKGADLASIREFFFSQEKVFALVVKMGANGAVVYTNDGKSYKIPIYKTQSVWPIGSGDVFSASFAFHWFQGNSLEKAAKKASWNTAEYCNTKILKFSPFESNTDVTPLFIDSSSEVKVYLAGPFFTFGERWIIDQIFRHISSMGLSVFSPWHHVGHGDANTVVPLDLEGLDKSNIVFAVVDGLDPGTLFEVGYAIAKGIPVVCYVEKESSENIKMMEGTNCIIEKDLTTAIYMLLWKAYQK